MSQKNNIKQLLVKHLIGDISESDQQTLNQWLNKDKQHQILFEDLQEEKNWKNRLSFKKKVDIDYEWSRFNKVIHPARKQYLKYGLKLAKYAAAICGPILILFALLTINKNETPPSAIANNLKPGVKQAQLILSNGEKIELKNKTLTLKEAQDAVTIENKQQTLNYSQNEQFSKQATKVYNEIVIGKGEEYKLVLADSTTVWLNSESHLKFPVQFEPHKREVILLAGEAFFDVSRDEHAPFTVKTNYIDVEVLGTSFNLSTYKNESLIHTTLVSGKVKVTPLIGYSEPQILSPNEQAILNKTNNNISIRQVDVSMYCSWRDGYFVFYEEKLEDVFKKLSRWYNIQFFFQSETARHERFSGKIPRFNNCDELLRMIEKTTDVTFQIDEKNNVVINKTR